MAAAGIRINAASSGVHYTSSIDGTANDWAITGWMSVDGTNGSSHGQMPFLIGNAGGFITVSPTDHTDDNASPWSINLWCLGDGSGVDTNMCAPVTGEAWFYAITYAHVSKQMYAYFVKDGGTLARIDAGTSHNGFTIDTIAVGGTTIYGWQSNVSCRNVKMWVGGTTLSQSEIDAERHSEAPVRATNLYGDWRLLSSAGLTDSSGNGRTMTIDGTVTSSLTLDPVDIQATTRRRLLCLVT